MLVVLARGWHTVPRMLSKSCQQLAASSKPYLCVFGPIKATASLLHKHTHPIGINRSGSPTPYSLLHCLHLFFDDFFFFFFSDLCSAISQWLLRKHLPPLRYVMSGQELKLLTGDLNNWALVCVSFTSAALPACVSPGR